MGVVNQNILPLAMALALHDAEVNGWLRFGRWLLATASGALSQYNDFQIRSAQSLLGTPP